jgi:hypothetical protein
VLAALQSGFRQREERIKVLIPSRMRCGTQWVDVTIHNMSSRGLMAGTDNPPAAGSYIEIRRGTQIIVGRVMWSKARFFGVRSQERLPIQAIISEPRLTGRPAVAVEASDAERRSDRRLSAEARLARRVERSRAFASAFQFGVLALAVMIAAGFGGHYVYEALSRPARAIERAMSAS